MRRASAREEEFSWGGLLREPCLTDAVARVKSIPMSH